MHSTTSVGAGRTDSPLPPADEVRAHLALVLASPAFRSSKRGARFLEFTVNEVLAGRGDTLKERTLAVEVFDRSPSWDAGDDTIVRVGAREVRKRLAQFYALPEASREVIRIELPLGSYVPEFVRVHGEAPQSAVPRAAPVVVAAVAPPRPKYAIRVAAAVLLTSALAFAVWRFFNGVAATPFDTFWAPFFRSSEPVLVAIAHPIVYVPSAHAYQLDSRSAPPGAPERSAGEPLHVPASALTGADFIAQPDAYLAFGDAVAAASVQALLAKHNRETHLRFASHIQFADMRDAPTIVIGGFSNRWSVEFTRHFRYYFGFDRHWIPSLLDSRNPDQSWTSKQASNGSHSEDHFLVCRIANSPSGTTIVIGAGISQFGTEAAGRFLSTPALMNQVLRGLPADWSSHNVELVLRVRVIGDSPAAPEMVASYVW